MSGFIDSHAHLSDERMSEDLQGVLKRAQEQGIAQVVNICTDEATLEKGLQLHKENPWIANAAATTPHDVEKDGEFFFPLVKAAAKAGQLCAIGETGLDYYYEHSPKLTQQEYFKRYCALALEEELPLIIHCRDAFEDFFKILDAHYLHDGDAPGVLHCFTGTLDEAKEVLKRGWYLSLSGIVTYKRSVELREVAKLVPLERLLIETDSPYLAPQAYRGKRNEPGYVVETAKCLAEEKGISLEELAAATAGNARDLFNLEVL